MLNSNQAFKYLPDRTAQIHCPSLTSHQRDSDLSFLIGKRKFNLQVNEDFSSGQHYPSMTTNEFMKKTAPPCHAYDAEDKRYWKYACFPNANDSNLFQALHGVVSVPFVTPFEYHAPQANCFVDLIKDTHENQIAYKNKQRSWHGQSYCQAEQKGPIKAVDIPVERSSPIAGQLQQPCPKFDSSQAHAKKVEAASSPSDCASQGCWEAHSQRTCPWKQGPANHTQYSPDATIPAATAAHNGARPAPRDFRAALLAPPAGAPAADLPAPLLGRTGRTLSASPPAAAPGGSYAARLLLASHPRPPAPSCTEAPPLRRRPPALLTCVQRNRSRQRPPDPHPSPDRRAAEAAPAGPPNAAEPWIMPDRAPPAAQGRHPANLGRAGTEAPGCGSCRSRPADPGTATRISVENLVG